MDEIGITEELMRQAPALGIFLLLAWRVLAHLEKREAAHQEADQARAESFLQTLSEREEAFRHSMEQRDETIREMGDECHAVQTRALDAMDANTATLAQVERVLTRMNGHEG